MRFVEECMKDLLIRFLLLSLLFNLIPSSSRIIQENHMLFVQEEVLQKMILVCNIQDYFIFSKQALHLITHLEEEAVIGRMQIDNFIMGKVYWNMTSNRAKSELVDATAVGKNHELIDIQCWEFMKGKMVSIIVKCIIKLERIVHGIMQ